VILPPIEIELDPLGRRCVPLACLRYVLECAREQEGAGLADLLAAVENALEAPLPGLTPLRADQEQGIPGLELAEPVPDPVFGLVHPGA
jgi:hypothetical protein